MCIASVRVCVRDGVKKCGEHDLSNRSVQSMALRCWQNARGFGRSHTIAKTMSSPSNLDDWLQNSRRQCAPDFTFQDAWFLFISSSANATLCVCYVRYSVRAIPRVQLKMTDLFLNSATIRHARHRREAPMHETNLGFRLVWSARRLNCGDTDIACFLYAPCWLFCCFKIQSAEQIFRFANFIGRNLKTTLGSSTHFCS